MKYGKVGIVENTPVSGLSSGEVRNQCSWVSHRNILNVMFLCENQEHWFLTCNTASREDMFGFSKKFDITENFDKTLWKFLKLC